MTLDPSHAAWYLARASGVVAWLLATASVVFGALLVSRLVARRGAPRYATAVHRHLAFLTVTTTAVHLAALVADSWSQFGIVELTVPFASAWKPGPVAAGVIAAWIIGIVQLTSLLGSRIPKRWWRTIHLASYGAWWAATWHAATAGTDTASPWVWVPVVVGVAAVTFTATARVLARCSPAPREPRPAAAAASRT